MSNLQQILFGTSLLAICAVIHVCAIAASVPFLRFLAVHMPGARGGFRRMVAFLITAVFIAVAAHTVQVWLWAATLMLVSELSDFWASFYFVTVTYTTVGYGDIVLGEHSRILGTFCAITGLLTFGITTAYLLGVLSRVMPDVLGGMKN